MALFFLRRQLSEGLALFRHQKHRIVAEASLAHWREGDGAVAAPLRRQGIPIGEGAGNGTGKVGFPGGLPPHGVQKQHVPSPVVQLLPAVAGGIDAGPAVQGVHAETGVVRDGGQAGGLADGPGLQHGVFLKGGSRLLHIHGDPHIGGAHHLDAQVRKDGRHLFQLARIVRGQHEFPFHIQPPSASFCTISSSMLPLAHSRTSSCCSAGVKARPSPVPWSSMISPASFMTQLRST